MASELPDISVDRRELSGRVLSDKAYALSTLLESMARKADASGRPDDAAALRRSAKAVSLDTSRMIAVARLRTGANQSI